MPDIGSELITYLKTKSGITSLVGSGVNARIYKHDAKQGVSLPYIVIYVYEGVSTQHISAISGVASNRVEVSCYASTDAGAYALAEAVRLAPLQMYRGTMGSTYVHTVDGESSYDQNRDVPVKGANEIRYWYSRDYFIHYTEPTS